MFIKNSLKQVLVLVFALNCMLSPIIEGSSYKCIPIWEKGSYFFH